MKKLFILSVFFSILLSAQLSAQPAQGNIVVITTFELNFSDEFSGRELDSLAQAYENAVIAKNEYIIDYKTVRHLWGANNRDFVVIYTVKGMEDVEKANEKINELFEENWTTKEDRDKFNKAYNKYFTGKHSDEIYRQVVFK